MDNYILYLIIYIFLTTFFIFTKISDTTPKLLFLNLLIACIISASTFFGIEYINSENTANFIKSPSIIFLFFYCLILFKILFLNNNDFIEKYSKNNSTDLNLIFKISFILLSFFFYAILFLEESNIFTFFIISLFSIVLIYLATMPIIFVITILVTVFYFKTFIVLATIVSLLILMQAYSFTTSIKLKYFKSLIKKQLNDIRYNFSFKQNYLFKNKFRLYENNNIFNELYLHYKNDEKNITYFIKIDLKDYFNAVIKANNFDIFFVNSNFIRDIEFEFSDLKFYCSDNIDNKTCFKELRSITITDEPECLETFIADNFKLNSILKY